MNAVPEKVNSTEDQILFKLRTFYFPFLNTLILHFCSEEKIEASDFTINI